MLEADDHFNTTANASHCVGEANGKPPWYFYQENPMDRKCKATDDIVSDDEPLRLDDTQHATEKELRFLWSTRLKPLAHLLADVAMQEEKI